MTTRNPIDHAYYRCSILAALLQDYRKLAKSFNSRRWIELGVVAEGDRQGDATKKIEHLMDELAGLVSHLTILDMAAALEGAAQARLGNAIGEVRKARRQAEKKTRFPVYSDRLIAEGKSLGSLRALADLLHGFLDSDIEVGFKATKDARNNYAHGTDVRIPPSIDGDQARKFLKEIYEML